MPVDGSFSCPAQRWLRGTPRMTSSRCISRGAAGMWIAFLAVPRYRAEGVRISPVVAAAMVAGGLTIAIMIYAFIVIVLWSAGIELPAPAHWVDGGGTAPGPDGVIT